MNVRGKSKNLKNFGFRPQQGLLIMNSACLPLVMIHLSISSFRPQQGLLIMNDLNGYYKDCGISFRPQQGLLIMNMTSKELQNKLYSVSVPNRGYLL